MTKHGEISDSRIAGRGYGPVGYRVGIPASDWVTLVARRKPPDPR